MNQEIDLKSCEILRLQPDDIIKYQCDLRLEDSLEYKLKQIFPNNKIIVIPKQDNIEIIRSVKN